MTALVLALTTLVVAAPARADAGSFGLNGYTFGPNEYVVIDIGTLTRDCDVFWTTSDIYVVPSGSVGPGSALSDVSGSPNTLMGTGLGSGVFGEVIAITEPGGTLGPGTYDIVEDTCQNGIFDGSDTVLRNAFEVVIPTDVPVLPDPRIQQMKSGATAQAEYWTGAAKSYAAFFAATTAYTLISDATSLTGFYLTYVCSFLPEIEGSPVSPWCPTVGIRDVVKLQLDVVKTIVDRASYYNGIAADPPDPNFAGPSLPGPRERFTPPSDTALWAAVANWADHTSEINELSAAFLGSLEKYQGAALADDAAAALMHARDIQSYARLLNTALGNETSALSAVNSAASSSGINLNTAYSRLGNALSGLEANGVSATDERELRNLGADPEQIDGFVDALLDELGSEDVPASFTTQYNQLVSVNNQMSAAYTDLGNSMNAIISELEAVVGGSGATPYPRITSVSVQSLPVDQSRNLSVNCAGGCADLTVEWDLDDDGAFDDATGAAISHTFTSPGRIVIGARVTDADGRQAAAFVRSNVTTSNRPPSHGTPTPPADSLVEVPIGASQEFTVIPTDPDGDELTTQWTVGTDTVGTGTAYDFTASAAAAGQAHAVVAHTTDGRGRAATTRWTAIPVHPDADGDGWHANVDCDDTNPDVNPGQPEIPGNGIDDDCDPSTLDTGPPEASFDFAPSPAVLDEPVTFTSTATDPDGPIATWAWDFDADGVVDATTAEAGHTFTTAGDHVVRLTVTDSDGLEDDITRTVTVTDRPVAEFTYAPSPAVLGNPVDFTDTSSDADGIAGWEWDFDYDGVSFDVDSTEQHPQHVFAATSTVALRVTDTHGVVSEVTSHEVRVSGPPVAAFSPLPETGLGDVARLEHGGQAVLWSSQANASTSAQEMIDTDYPSGETGWSTGSGLVTNQWAIIDLGASWQVEAIAIQPTSTTTQRPRDVRLGLSSTGQGPGGFTTVVDQELANDATLQVLELPTPTDARWLRYDALNNRGNTTAIRTDRLQALTGQLGGATVTFTDRSTDADGDIESWAWDFGDGQTSTEQNPTHTYAAPGDYTVTLTITYDQDNESTRSLLQRVVPELAEPTFTFPDTLLEASSARFTDTTTVTDRAIVERIWSWGDGGATTGGALSPSRSFSDNGDYDVTLTLTDSYGMTSSTTQTVTVENRPPTGGAGSNFQGFVSEVSPGVVGLVWTPNATASDPSAIDRATLHCAWDYGDGSDVVEIQPCNNTTVRVPHTYTVGEHTATLTITDKDGGELVTTTSIVAEKAPTYLNVYPVPGTADGNTVSVRAKLWNAAAGYAPIAGAPLTVTLGEESRTLTTDASGEVALSLPLGTDRSLSAAFAENDYYLAATDVVQIPTVQRPPGDIVFTVDESGSMGGVQAQIRANVIRIANQLAEELDYQISVMGFGGGFPAVDGRLGYLPRIIVPATDDLDDVAAAAAALTTGGGTEPGINAIIDALGPDVGLRPGAGKCVVLVGDEPTQQYQVTPADAAQALAANDAILFSIITVADNTLDYQELATNSGGAFFPINDFADDPEPVLQALLDSCATALVQRPDLTVSIDDGRGEVSAGETLTYTVTVDNVGPIDASGVELEVELPDGVTFVSAGDGGTAGAGVVSWPLFEVASGVPVTRTVTVTVDADVTVGDSLTATAEAFDDGTNGTDLTPANNVDSDVDTVVAVPTLTVVTEVVNDDGGSAVASDFTVEISRDGTVVATDAGDQAGTLHTLTAGSYAVDGGSLAGYTTTISGDCAADGTVTLGAGGAYTCTIVHDDQPVAPATLTLVTQVINDDGGVATADQFTVTVSDVAGVVSTSPGSTTGTELALEPGDYAVDGGSLVGYASTVAGDCAADGTITLAAGGEYTCTVVHNDIAVPPATLTVVTQVVNDDGGTAVAADFTVTVSVSDTVVHTDPGDPDGTEHQLVPGDYTVAGGTLAGYTMTVSGDCAADGRITLPPGADRTCVITHDDIAGPTATLTVTTVVVNDDGGSASPEDFTVALSGAEGVIGTGPGTSDGETRTIPVGSYTLDGGGLAGYASSIGGDCAADGTISLAAGDELACTITHDDIPGSLLVTLEIEGVGPDGPATAEDFELTVNGTVADFDVATVLPAGQHAVSVDGPAGYVVTVGPACATDGSITLGLDEHRECAVVARAVEEPTTEEPTEEPTTEEPTEEPTTEEPTEEPTTEEPTEEPTTEEPTTEEPTTDEPTVAPTDGPSTDPSTPTPPDGGDLPRTGAGPVLAWLALAAMVVLLGALMVRRRAA